MDTAFSLGFGNQSGLLQRATLGIQLRWIVMSALCSQAKACRHETGLDERLNCNPRTDDVFTGPIVVVVRMFLG